MEVDPTDPIILNYRGDISFISGNHSEAINYYKKVLTIYPKEDRALGSIGDVLYNMGDYSEALGIITRLYLYIQIIVRP